MDGPRNKLSKLTRRRVLLGISVISLVLASAFCGWLYKEKTQRDLNIKMLGTVRRGAASPAILLLAHCADPNIRDEPEQQLNLWGQS